MSRTDLKLVLASDIFQMQLITDMESTVPLSSLLANVSLLVVISWMELSSWHLHLGMK